jgi:hypothetical protein
MDFKLIEKKIHLTERLVTTNWKFINPIEFFIDEVFPVVYNV